MSQRRKYPTMQDVLNELIGTRVRIEVVNRQQRNMRFVMNDAIAGEEAFEKACDISNGISAYLVEKGLSEDEVFRQRPYLLLEEIKLYDRNPHVRYWLTKFVCFMAEEERMIGHA